MKVLHLFSDLLFPSHCVVCNKSVTYSEHYLCEECSSSIKSIENGCERCSGVVRNGKCIICSERSFYLDRNISIAEYSQEMKTVINHFKLQKNRRLAHYLGKLVLDCVISNKLQPEVITAVPMSRKKRWERGFNQSELLAKKLSKSINIPYIPVLSEKSSSITQKTLGYKERFINVLDRYQVKKTELCKGRQVLIVDDIFTSGATLNECARILKNAGAATVFSITIARAIKMA